MYSYSCYYLYSYSYSYSDSRESQRKGRGAEEEEKEEKEEEEEEDEEEEEEDDDDDDDSDDDDGDRRAAPARAMRMHGRPSPGRSENKELFRRLRELGVEIYQQPAGFEDSVITVWKIQHQAKAAACSIGLRDMFAGALSESAINASAAFGQLPVFIRGKMTAAVQVTDTDVAFRLKAKVRRRQMELRKELQRLAEVESTRAVFKCGNYEVLRTVASAIEDLRSDFEQDDTLRKSCVRNMWTVLRPKPSSGGFVKASEEK
eukprot:5838707-Pyramimonas_sp.AAC.1